MCMVLIVIYIYIHTHNYVYNVHLCGVDEMEISNAVTNKFACTCTGQSDDVNRTNDGDDYAAVLATPVGGSQEMHFFFNAAAV